MKQAFWIRYPYHGGLNHAAVVAESLEEAFDKLSKETGVDPLDMEYRNRVIDVLI